jgi:predicted  nucleic acid-binding Zn-ribbon protein
MQKRINSPLFLFSLVLAITVIFSLASFAAAKNETSTGKSTGNQAGRLNAEEYRSAVANFVQTILNSADTTEEGIGEQVKTIARQQNQSASTTIQAMEKVQTRNKVKTFLIGSDYKNIGALRSEMVQTRNRLEQLNRIMENVQNEGETAELQNQIQTLEQEQTKIENFIKAEEGKFSLFGWFVRLFN